MFAVSRPTMRQALDELAREGLVMRRRGVGTVVTQQRFHRTARPTSVFDDLVTAGRTPTTTVLAAELIDAPPAIAEEFGADAKVVALERLRSADGEPLVVMRNWIPARYSFLIGGPIESLYRVMRQHGDEPVTAHKSVSAVPAESRPARLLGVRRGSPLLRVRHVGHDATGAIVDVGDHLYRGDQHTLEVAE